MTANYLQTLHIYEENGMYVFDDPKTGLVKEPFVAGIPEIIDTQFKGPVKSFTAIFSDQEFPGYTIDLKKLSTEFPTHFNGTWYQFIHDGVVMLGWLCPALYKYFVVPPENIFIQITNVVYNG